MIIKTTHYPLLQGRWSNTDRYVEIRDDVAEPHFIAEVETNFIMTREQAAEFNGLILDFLRSHKIEPDSTANRKTGHFDKI